MPTTSIPCGKMHYVAKTGNPPSGRRTIFTVAELMRRYPDGNIPDLPDRDERRVRKLARKRLAKRGIVYSPPAPEGENDE